MSQRERASGGEAAIASRTSARGASGAMMATGACRTRRNLLRAFAPDRGSYPFGAPPCRIYRPARSVMQAGRGRTAAWVLEFESTGRRWIEPLMGWTATDDPFAQIHLTFPMRAGAVDYAERMGLDYTVVEPAPERPKPCVLGTTNRIAPARSVSGPSGLATRAGAPANHT